MGRKNVSHPSSRHSAPSWVAGYESTSGLPDPRTAGAIARLKHCRTCGRMVIAGYDSPVAAFLAVCDPARLTPTEEAAAVVLARPTYELTGPIGQWALERRTPTDATFGVLPPASGLVAVAEHTCDRPPLGSLPLPAPPVRVVNHGPPPF